MKVVSLVLIMLLFSACGYTPSAKFSRDVVGEKVSTSIIVSSVDPENTVIIKDAMDAAIIEVFHASLTSKSLAKTHLVVNLSDPVYAPVQYDAQGFVVGYRAYTTIFVTRSTGESNKKYTAKGTYDFDVTPNSVITDKQRFNAIKFSSVKAIRAFVSQVSAEGARENNKKED